MISLVIIIEVSIYFLIKLKRKERRIRRSKDSITELL
jgi:hypothetical protein